MLKPFLAAVAAAVIAILVVSSSPHADTPTGGGGMTRVVHDGTLTGSGTTANPLSAVASGDITSVVAGTGLSGGATSGAATLTLAMTAQTCGASSFITSATATGVFGCASAITTELGDIESVTAGNGLTGGGSTGALTLDVACGTNLLCNANDVSLNLSGASCSAGSYVSAIGATGTGTCTAEVGDISSVGATSNMGLTGGSTSGAALLGLISTCANGQVLKSGSSGTTWTCADDTGAPSLITASLAGNVNDWSPAGFGATVTVVNLTSVSSGPFNITGIDGTGRTSGSILILLNNGGQSFTVPNESGSSAAGNRIKTMTAATRTIGNYGAIILVKDGTNWSEASESTRYAAELYSNSSLTVTTTSTLLGAVSTFGSDFIGDSSADLLTVNSTASFIADATVKGNTTLGDNEADTTDIWGRVHYRGTAPTLTGCTSTCSMDSYSTAARGRVSCSDDSGSDCTVTFATAYTTNAPACSIVFEKSTGPTTTPWLKSVSISAFVFDQNSTGAQAYAYRCDGML